MSKPSLKTLRTDWEKNYTLMDEWRPDDDTMLVILRDKDHKYFCHRYFKTIEGWFVNVDVRNGHVVTVFNWIRNPRNLSITENAKHVLHKLPGEKRQIKSKKSEANHGSSMVES